MHQSQVLLSQEWDYCIWYAPNISMFASDPVLGTPLSFLSCARSLSLFLCLSFSLCLLLCLLLCVLLSHSHTLPISHSLILSLCLHLSPFRTSHQLLLHCISHEPAATSRTTKPWRTPRRVWEACQVKQTALKLTLRWFLEMNLSTCVWQVWTMWWAPLHEMRSHTHSDYFDSGPWVIFGLRLSRRSGRHRHRMQWSCLSSVVFGVLLPEDIFVKISFLIHVVIVVIVHWYVHQEDTESFPCLVHLDLKI